MWIARSCTVFALLAIAVAAASTGGQEGGAPRLEGRGLSEALQELERRGLRIIYSSEAVRPGMRVRVEPRSASPRRILDEILAPHGLIARDGPGGILTIVKDRRARPRRAPPAAAGAPPPLATGDPSRFEETVVVTDVDPRIAAAGPPALSLRALDVRGLAGGFENVFRTLQALPGVAATEELGSRIAVRGGSPDQNLTIVDGIEIHNPYRLHVYPHDLGMTALGTVFNPETIGSVDLFPGAFDVRHGDRLSSLLVVSSRDGSDAEAFQGFASLSLVDANVVLEGKLPAGAGGSWLVSSRRTYFGVLADELVGISLPSFQDVQTRLVWYPRAGRRVSLAGGLGAERIRPGQGGPDDERHSTSTRNHLLALTVESGLGARASSRTIASVSRFRDALDASERSLDNSRGANTPDSIAGGSLLEFQMARHVAVRDVAVRQEFAFRQSDRHTLDTGFEAHALATRWNWAIAGDRSQHQANGSSVRLGASLPATLNSSLISHRLGTWIQSRLHVSERLALQPGVRVDYSSSTGRTTLSPRLSGVMNAGRGLRLDAAVRLHAQTPGYEKLFQSDYFLDLNRGAKLKPERSLHAVIGLQRNVTVRFRARADAYYRRFTDLIVGRLEADAERQVRLASYDVPPELQPAVPARAEITTNPMNGGTGHAYGVEVHVAHIAASSPLTGWASYSFARSSRTAYGVARPFDYDRRHAVSVAANLKVGSRLDVGVVGRWATGFPRTPVRGVRLALAADAEDVDGDGNRSELRPQRDAVGNPIFQPDLGDVANINSARLPHFARVDARMTYRPSLGGERWAFYLDFVNVLNAKNIIQIDSRLVFDPTSPRPRIVEVSQDRGLPFLPSFGVRFWF